jgi:hypothetical protein
MKWIILDINWQNCVATALKLMQKFPGPQTSGRGCAFLQDEKRQSRDQYLGAKRRVSKELGPLHIGVVEPHAAVIISV